MYRFGLLCNLMRVHRGSSVTQLAITVLSAWVAVADVFTCCCCVYHFLCRNLLWRAADAMRRDLERSITMRVATAAASYFCVDENLGVEQRMHSPGAWPRQREGNLVSKAALLSEAKAYALPQRLCHCHNRRDQIQQTYWRFSWLDQSVFAAPKILPGPHTWENCGRTRAFI